jgi:thiol:disulfide interchange protein
MIFLHRLGIVLYWVGYVFAFCFAIVSLLIALNGLSFGGAISEAWVFAVLSVVTWLWGRAMKYILTDT